MVPELCRATGLTDRQKSDFRIMKDVGGITILKPNVRYDKITSLAKEISNHQGKGIEFEVDLNSNRVVGYQMDFPQIQTNRLMTLTRDKL